MFDITNNKDQFTTLVKIFDTEVYPNRLDNAYGIDEVKVVVDRFCDLPNANGCDVMKIKRESGMR